MKNSFEWPAAQVGVLQSAETDGSRMGGSRFIDQERQLLYAHLAEISHEPGEHTEDFYLRPHFFHAVTKLGFHLEFVPCAEHGAQPYAIQVYTSNAYESSKLDVLYRIVRRSEPAARAIVAYHVADEANLEIMYRATLAALDGGYDMRSNTARTFLAVYEAAASRRRRDGHISVLERYRGLYERGRHEAVRPIEISELSQELDRAVQRVISVFPETVSGGTEVFSVN